VEVSGGAQKLLDTEIDAENHILSWRIINSLEMSAFPQPAQTIKI
jgi:hypothetical protein